MNKKKKERSKNNSYIIPGIIMVIIIIAILSSFGIQMISNAKNQVAEGYQRDVAEICEMYKKEVYGVTQVSLATSKQIKIDGDLFCEDNLEEIKNVTLVDEISNVYLVSTDFMAVDAKGQTYQSIIDKPGFTDLVEYKKSSGVFYQDDEGNPIQYISVPITVESDVKGILVTEFKPSVLGTLLENPKYSARKTYALVSSDGKVIEATGKESNICTAKTNIIENAESYTFLDGSYSGFKQALNDCRTGYQQISGNGVSEYIYYAPITDLRGVAVIIVDTEDVDRSFEDVSKTIRSMLIEICITIVAFIALFLGIGLFSKAKYNVENESLQNKADTDQLTDLYNKMATERLIKEYIAGEGRNSVSMLFVIDVDNFKKINDTMGHAFGDKVLSQLGHQIKAWFRVNDIVGRIGGDEFMIFIKDVKDPEVIKREGSRIMQFFQGFNVGEYTRYSPTASVGGAVFPNDGKDFDALYKAADKAVYKSKKQGKNQVSFYSDLKAADEELIEKAKEASEAAEETAENASENTEETNA